MSQDASKTNTRNWSVVLNNYTEEELTQLILMTQIEIHAGKLIYAIIAHEVGEEKTPHLQCYFRFKSERKWTCFKKISQKFHCEPCYASPLKNMEYCKKGGDFQEFGTPPTGTGKRTDLDEIKDMAKAGAPMAQMYEVASGYQALKMAEYGLRIYSKNTLRKMEVIWIWGPSGSGKSETAYLLEPDAYWLNNGKWWDGYEEQKCVIIDDFRETMFPFRELLRLLDVYPLRLEVKGGSRVAKYEKVIITCPFPPQLCYTSEKEEKHQLLRRISQIMEMGKVTKKINEMSTDNVTEQKSKSTEVGSNTSADPQLHDIQEAMARAYNENNWTPHPGTLPGNNNNI